MRKISSNIGKVDYFYIPIGYSYFSFYMLNIHILWPFLSSCCFSCITKSKILRKGTCWLLSFKNFLWWHIDKEENHIVWLVGYLTIHIEKCYKNEIKLQLKKFIAPRRAHLDCELQISSRLSQWKGNTMGHLLFTQLFLELTNMLQAIKNSLAGHT